MDAAVKEFLSITGTTDKVVAKAYLEAAGGVAEAIELFFTSGGEAAQSPPKVAREPSQGQRRQQQQQQQQQERPQRRRQQQYQQDEYEDDFVYGGGGGGSSAGGGGGGSIPQEYVEDEDGVRAPIAPRFDTLAAPLPVMNVRGGRHSRVMRDLRAQGFAAGVREDVRLPFIDAKTLTQNAAMAGHRAKANQLNEMFALPPNMNNGQSFQDAVLYAKTSRKWLLVCINNPDVFECSVMTRDIWRNEMVGTIVQDNFVFWERSIVSEQGRRYKSYYPFTAFPHIAIVDPRTDERIKVFPEKQALESFIDQLLSFVHSHSLESHTAGASSSSSSSSRRTTDAAEAVNKRARFDESIFIGDEEEEEEEEEGEEGEEGEWGQQSDVSGFEEDEDGSGDEGQQQQQKQKRKQQRQVEDVVDADEDEALKLALKESLAEEERRQEEAEAEEERKRKEAEERNKAMSAEPPADAEGVCTVRMIFPDGSRIQRRFLQSDTLDHMRRFARASFEAMTKQDFLMLTSFPKRNLMELDPRMTLGEAKISARETIHVEEA